MQQTSLEAYWTLGATKIGKRQQQILDALDQLETACNRQLSEKANLPINVVTPRIGELREKGLVEEAYKDVDKVTNRKAIFWKRRV